MAKRHFVPSDTVDAILGQHASHNVKLSELVGSTLESGQNPYAKGDKTRGVFTSFGPYQIHLPAHPGVTRADATNPYKATALMRGAYESAVKKVGTAAFKANPEKAAEEAAVLAERPAQTYYASRGTSAVHAAYLSSHATLTNLGGGTPAPILATGHVTSASKAAARKLYAAGIRGQALVISLATLGAFTKGKYSPGTTASYIQSYKANHGKIKNTVIGSAYENGNYLPYIGRALSTLKAIGHKTPFHYTGSMPGEKIHEPGLVSGDTVGAIVSTDKHAAEAVIGSVGAAIKWISNPDHLIRIGFILLGFILIIVGLAKLSGATIPAPEVKE